MDNVRLTSLFQRYLRGSCSREEESELLAYLAEYDTEEVRALLQNIWNNPDHSLSVSQEQRLLSNILASTRNAESTTSRWRWIGVAATLGLAIAVAFGVYRFTTVESTTEAMATVAPPDYGHQFIRLPDGSTVILRQGSKLDYPASFADRIVSLSGEAFFDIVHHENKPFVVRTGQLVTTVLGTAFNVRAYDDQDDVTVTVTRGSVRVSDRDKVLGTIAPNEQITFHKPTRGAQQQAVQATDFVAWADEDIYFDDVSIGDAVSRIESKFNVSIKFEQERFRDCRFTATFAQDEDLAQILDVICTFNNLHYTRDDAGNIEISGVGCTPNPAATN